MHQENWVKTEETREKIRINNKKVASARHNKYKKKTQKETNVGLFKIVVVNSQ